MVVRKEICFVLLAGALLLACGKEEAPIQPGGEDKPTDEVVPETPEVPEAPEEEFQSPYVVSSAVMTFSYYDIEGQIDTLEQRIDFNMDVYGTDTPDLRNIPITLVTRDGFEAKNAMDGVVTMTLSTKKATKISFVKDTCSVDYDIYVTPTIMQAPATKFDFHAGVNLSYWFQSDVPWPEDETLEQVKECGFDHVRLPVDSFCLFDGNGNIRSDVMSQIHHVIEKALELGLNVIYDMHWLVAGNLFYQEPAAKELVNNWSKLMNELKKYPNERLAYEILNEPYGPGWGLMQRRMLHFIRKNEPERVIFVSPDEGYDVDNCAKFYLHKGDPNLVMTFHYYQPMLASHKKLWGYTGPSHYPGLLFSDEEWDNMSDAEKEIAQWHREQVYDYDYVYNKMRTAADMAEHNGLRLHCGEFGYSKLNIREERLQWFRDIVKAFNECNMAYTVWENWVGDFGPGDWQSRPDGDWQSRPDEEVIDILMQRE